MPSPIVCSLNFEELEKAGIPVKRGVRQFHVEDKKDPRALASGAWIHRWAKHAAINYPIVTKSMGIRDFEDCAIGVPVFCVGIGPSLDSNIHELKAVDGRALVFSTDAALKPLLANNIQPQVVMSFDCGDNQKTLFQNVPRGTMEQALLVVNSCTHPDTIASWHGPKAFFNQYHQQDEFIAKLLPYIYPNVGSLPSAGTVGNMLVILAHFFGALDIFLVGMDLCYGAGEHRQKKGWQYRATDYNFRNGDWVKQDNPILYDNDARVAHSFDEEIGGQTYRTDPELKLYRESIVAICRALKINPVDCSDGILKHFFKTNSIGEAVIHKCRTPMPKYRSVLFSIKELFGGHKIYFDNPIGAVDKTLSEDVQTPIRYGNGCA